MGCPGTRCPGVWVPWSRGVLDWGVKGRGALECVYPGIYRGVIELGVLDSIWCVSVLEEKCP